MMVDKLWMHDFLEIHASSGTFCLDLSAVEATDKQALDIADLIKDGEFSKCEVSFGSTTIGCLGIWALSSAVKFRTLTGEKVIVKGLDVDSAALDTAKRNYIRQLFPSYNTTGVESIAASQGR